MSKAIRYRGLLLDAPPYNAPPICVEYTLASDYDALAAENAKLREYARHKNECNLVISNYVLGNLQVGCSCGFEKATALQPSEP